MVKYVCGRCGYVFGEEEMKVYRGKVQCPRCTYEIIYKVARPYRLVKAV